MRTTLSWVLLVLGTGFLAAAVPIGSLNRTVLDAPEFAQRIDQLRQRDDVGEILGRELSQQLIAQNPDLVAVAPLVDQIAIGVVSSDILSGPVRLAASQFHRALTTENSDQLVLRVADAGAVAAGVVAAVAPGQAPGASQVAITLADVGSQGFATDIIRSVRLADTLAWLLPALALVCFVAVIVIGPDRRRAIYRIGWAGIAAAVSVAALVIVGGAAIRAAGGDPRTDALLDGVWDLFVRPIWWPVGLVAAAGALAVMIGAGSAAAWRPTALTGWFTRPPRSSRGVVARAALSITGGLALVLEPRGTITIVAFVVGVALVVSGVGALARLGPSSRTGADAGAAPAATGDRWSWLPLAAITGIAVIALAVLAVWVARPPDDDVAGAVGDAVAGEGEVCNGHAELCEMRFDQVSYAASHNSMSVAGKPGWYLGEQGLDIVPQLDSGVRALLVDVWYGRAASEGRVRTAARSYEEALDVAEQELGPEIVDSALRVFDALAPGEPEGDEALYMCHGLCETGATSFDETLNDIRAWLATNPDEVLTIFVEDHVDANDVATAVLAAGLEDYLHTPASGEPFPTLGEMIRSGTRLIVMLETGDGRPDHPWLVNGFDFVQETPYTFPTPESFSCRPNRGGPDAPLLQINHWLAGFTELVSSAQQVNAADVLGPRVEQCRDERGLQPTLVAVNFTDIGDLMAVVDRLNGVG